MFILDYRQARGSAGREDGGPHHDEVSAAVAADPGAVPRHVQGAHTAPASSHCCSLLLLTSLSRVAGGRTRAGGHQGGRGGQLCASARETAAQVNLTILMHENCFMKQEIDVNSTSSAEHVAMNGAYLLDAGDSLLLFLGKVLQPFFCEKVRHCTAPLQGYIVELWLFRCLESANLWMLTRT